MIEDNALDEIADAFYGVNFNTSWFITDTKMWNKETLNQLIKHYMCMPQY